MDTDTGPALDDEQAWPEGALLDPELAPLAELFEGVTFVFWMCPDGHSDLTAAERARRPTVEWVDGVAHCLTAGCGRTSQRP